jgi:hypothetical protein
MIHPSNPAWLKQQLLGIIARHSTGYSNKVSYDAMLTASPSRFKSND